MDEVKKRLAALEDAVTRMQLVFAAVEDSMKMVHTIQPLCSQCQRNFNDVEFCEYPDCPCGR